LERLGDEVVTLPALEGLADSAFVEDVALVLPEVAVATRPGAESRREEVARLQPVLQRYRDVLELDAPCTLDGGDVLIADDVLYVGQSTRTNHPGLKRLAHLLLEFGYRIKAVTVTRSLHLKTGCSRVLEGALLVNRGWVDVDRFPDFQLVDVDPREPFAANVIAHGKRVLCAASAPRTAERLAQLGLEPTLVDISEFEKAEAGLTCLSLRFDPSDSQT